MINHSIKILNLIFRNILFYLWRIIRLPFEFIGYIFKGFTVILSIFLGPSDKNSKIGSRFLAIIAIALISFGSWAGLSEFDKAISGQQK